MTRSPVASPRVRHLSFHSVAVRLLAFWDQLSAEAIDRNRSIRTLRHVTGALVVRLGNQPNTPLDAWCELADRASDSPWIGKITSCLLDLLRRLCRNAHSEVHIHWLGRAARRLLKYALGHPSNHSIAGYAIEFVAMTYRSDSNASRCLLRRLFDRDHFTKKCRQ